MALQGHLYYRHSGRFSVFGLIGAFLFGALAASLAGAIYSLVILYLPMAAWVAFLGTAGFGLFVGKMTGVACRVAKIRNDRAAKGVCLAAQLVGYYVAWASWIYLLLLGAKVEGITLAQCLHPAVLFSYIPKVYEVGAWGLSEGTTCNGSSLGLVWLLEAAIIFVTAYRSVKLSEPFCENCLVWCKSKHIAQIEPLPLDQLKSALETRRLEELSLSSAGECDDRVLLDLASCPRCQQFHTLSARNFLIVKKGDKLEEVITQVVDRLLVTSDEALALQHLRLLNKDGRDQSPSPHPRKSPSPQTKE